MQSALELKAPAGTWRRALKKRLSRINRLFFLTVVVPTVLATIYFGLIASDVYVSESRFVVRSPDKQMGSGLGALLKGAGFSRAQDDSYTVHDYVLSRDALKEINDKLGVGKAFASGHVDLFSRFGGLDFDVSFEALHRYYQKKVEMLQDSVSSISTLTVRAYTAQDAVGINQKLLELSEAECAAAGSGIAAALRAPERDGFAGDDAGFAAADDL